jgi:RNA polymerase sigma-70 factor (ECF subfamily)
MSWLQVNRPADLAGFDDRVVEAQAPEEDGPEALAMRAVDRRMLNDALAALPTQFREVLVLRELEDLSYKEIARVADLPIGTVMSRLARGRRLLGEFVRAVSRAAEQRVER